MEINIVDFFKGNLENVNIEGSNIKLKNLTGKYCAEGIFTSDEIEIAKFNKLIVSWNSITPVGTYVEIEAKVYDETINKWSEWLSWGKWGTSIKSESTNNSCSVATIETDVLDVIKGVASKAQVRAKLFSEASTETPLLLRVILSTKNTMKDTYKDNINIERIIDTPRISQYLREPSIANSICSPTSITMMLNRMGEELIVEEVAKSCYDYKYDGFGNWSYNIAFAGSLGYEAYVAFGDIVSLKKEIEADYPAAVSVKYSNDINNQKYPYIENAPVTTGGHLIVVCGIVKDTKGQEYVVVNDPAAKRNEEVTLKYKMESFKEAWDSAGNVMYIIHNRK